MLKPEDKRIGYHRYLITQLLAQKDLVKIYQERLEQSEEENKQLLAAQLHNNERKALTQLKTRLMNYESKNITAETAMKQILETFNDYEKIIHGGK